MLIPEDIRWDKIDDGDNKVTPIFSTGYDRIKLLFEREYDQKWAQLLAPNVDAWAATIDILEYISDVGQDIDAWPDDYDSAPLLRRNARIRHKHSR